MEDYIVFQMSEDGDIYIEQIDYEKLLTRINNRYYSSVVFLDQVPTDPYSQGGYALIIKGEIVRPQPVKTVTEYTLP